MSINRKFFKYVSQNILGMIGMSLYILADTYFISKAVGSDGITALNLVLPIYSLIFAFGSMVGVGSAIRFSIEKSQNNKKKSNYFTNALFWGTLVGIIFSVIGITVPKQIINLLGGTEHIVNVGESYTKIFMAFAPCFIWNHICNAFVRNDGNPSIAMAATMISSLFNIIFDYVLMFPLGMGMSGAALATALSPLVGVLICCIHFFSKSNTISFKLIKPSVCKLFFSVKVGVSAFVGEISSGVITMLFNMLILKLTGNTGVAAYGVVANTSLVAVSVFNGIAQGSQPILSEYYGKGDKKSVRKICLLGVVTALCLAAIILVNVYILTKQIAGIFNSENNKRLAEYAFIGLRLYFIGFLFAGVNIVGTGFFSAIDKPNWAFVSSILRGFVVITICAIILAGIFGMNGVWMAFPTAEFITMIVTGIGIHRCVYVKE